jgi:leucyl-tRNA synthetase
METAHSFRLTHKKAMLAKNAQKPTDGCVWIAKTFPPWQSCVLDTMRELFEKNNSTLPDNKLISVELGKKEILKKHMKKVMPFVAMVRERVEKLGKIAMAVTVDFDEKEIMETNAEYLRNTLDLETLEIRFTDDPTATEKMKEEVRPGIPYIAYSTKPSIKVVFENPIPRSGHFTQFLHVSDGDTTQKLKEKLMKSLGLKAVEPIQIWRFEDSVLGPRKIPTFGDYKTGKVQLEDGNVSIDLKTDAVYITTADNKKTQVGTSFIYVVA